MDDLRAEYTRDVTPAMFRRVLLGDPELKKAGKKVLESGPGDNVFIFFTDHGAPNLIGFPNGELYARQLQDIFTNMNKKKGYNSLVMYVEACYAGSMFENLLPTNMRIFVTTAANAHESSWASFCDDPKVGTCLADAYSYTWMSDSEHHDLKSWTLSNQFQFVKNHVQSSHVMEYGDMKLSNTAVAAFQAGDRRPLLSNKRNTAKLEALDSRPAVQAHLVHLMHRIKMANTQDKQERAHRHLNRVLELAKMAQETMDEIVHDVTQQAATPVARNDVNSHLDCYETVFENYKTKCFSIQQVPEVAQELRKLDQLCKQGYEVEKIVQAIFDVCG
ncbi:unnamed protein product [Echinostoma caproni]|uniref:Legumain n=1 Tax=Echinostoma caproni TaxID=27848 RepID=A0A183A801_9TREM|nr:unnamed protein product [Echinostoma caproni]